jgi:hypothetical protein
MIQKRQTRKVCNICKRVVAVKKIFLYETLHKYVTLHADDISLFATTTPVDVHICRCCWERMEESVKAYIKKSED